MPSTPMRPAMRRPLLMVVAAWTLLAILSNGGSGFASQVGQTRKQTRGTLHNKDRLPTFYELPREEPTPEAEPPEPLPERRVPYTMNIEAHSPDGSNMNWRYVERKLVHALQNFEDLIQHVEVRVHHQEHFRREKRGRRGPLPLVSEELDEGTPVMAAASHTGAEALAPFRVTAKVNLRNHRQVILSNPEKHAQPTLTEAVDHATDLLRKLLHAEKERNIRFWRKQHRLQKESLREEDPLLDDEDGLLEDADALDRLADQQMERLYHAVEAASAAEAAGVAEAASAVGTASAEEAAAAADRMAAQHEATAL